MAVARTAAEVAVADHTVEVGSDNTVVVAMVEMANASSHGTARVHRTCQRLHSTLVMHGHTLHLVEPMI